jgi:hypothetical protein
MTKLVDRLLPVVGVAMLVAALVLGAGSLRALSGGDGPSPQVAADPSTTTAPITAPTAGPNGVTELDLGPTDADDLAACTTPDFTPEGTDPEVLYGVRQLRLGGTSAVLMLRNARGEVRLCDRFGTDAPSQAPLPSPTAEEPVAFLSNGRAAWTCDGTRLRRFEQSTWLVVSPAVATVRERFWVAGVPGPWFETRAHGGYAHLQTWLQGPEPRSRYAQQFQVLDADGTAVPQTALPTEKRPLTGCQGGSVEIG